MRLWCLIVLSLFTIGSLTAQSAGVMFSPKDNETAASLYVTFPPVDSAGGLSLQFNAANLTIIPSDPYNRGEKSTSNFTLFALGSGLISSILLGGDDFGGGALPESTVLRKVVPAIFAPFFLANTQWHVNFVRYEPEHPAGLFPSAFLGIQTDSYFGDDAKWLRTAPSLGVELRMVFGTTDSTGAERPTIEAALQIATQKYWDFSSAFHPQTGTRSFVTFKLGWVFASKRSADIDKKE